jgi:hypothetical protein
MEDDKGGYIPFMYGFTSTTLNVDIDMCEYFPLVLLSMSITFSF